MSEGIRVLCVDDDPDVVELSATYLRRELEGATVYTATDAEGALDVLDERSVDCVVSDHEMPDRTGLDLLRDVRERGLDVPFILFTGKGSEEIASEAISAGVTDYLEKQGPEGYELLAYRVENAVSQWEAERTLQETRRKMARLHSMALDLRETDDPDAVYERAATAARQVLEFSTCGFFVAEEGVFQPAAVVDFELEFRPFDLDEGLIGATYQSGESKLVDDVQADELAAPVRESFRSCIAVPVGDEGVFQAISDERGFFGEHDLELAELLVSHVGGALDRIANERDLRRTNEQLETLLERTTANIYIKDLEGRYELVNDAFANCVGVDRESLVGKTDEEIQDVEVASEIRANDRRAIEEGEPIEVEESAVWEGERRVYYSVKAPVFDADGEPKGVCGVSSDITELKERESELRRKTERLDEFVSVVSHDLRNPLTVAQGHAELLEPGEPVDPEAVRRLSESLDRMEAILEDLLTLARSGRGVGETSPVDLGAVAREAWRTVDTGEASLTVEGERRVEADRSRLVQLFENLFRNSVEHGSTSGRTGSDDAVEHAVDHPAVRVEVTETGFAVVDDGPGLPADVREKLRRPEVTANEDELGFGLAIVDRIATAHGWELSVPETDGGARFEFETA